MFSKDSKDKGDMPGPDLGGMTPGAAQAIAATPSIISADLKIIGNMHSNGDIQIDGQIDGDIDSKSLTIGESAKVNGTVSCERVRVCGRVIAQLVQGERDAVQGCRANIRAKGVPEKHQAKLAVETPVRDRLAAVGGHLEGAANERRGLGGSRFPSIRHRGQIPSGKAG